MKITLKKHDNAINRADVKPGEVYQLANGSVYYLATVWQDNNMGSNAVQLEKGYKTKHEPDQQVILFHAELILTPRKPNDKD